MRYRKTLILISALAAVSFMSACKEETPTVSFGVSSSTITIGAEGGNEVIHIDAEDGWTANSTSPWISISPSNGIGSADCEIIIDTTLLADKTREGIVRFMSKSNKTADIRVVQTGYQKMIVLNKTEVDVPSYEDYKKRYIDVEVTANVDFVPTVTADKEWVQLQDYDFELDRGSRPRTVKLRLRWENNTRPAEREALLSFKAKDGSELAKNDKLSVKQVAADEIEDSRRGDSLAVVGCARSLGFDISEFEGESMDHWTFLTLWEKGNKGYTEDKKGRVRSIKRGAASSVLSIEAPAIMQGVRIGDSIATNGVCLTATRVDDAGFCADVMHETLQRSSLGALSAGSAVNLERAMPANGRFGGHIVSGHIDGTGRIASTRRDDVAVWYDIEAPEAITRYVVEKGSIAIDGVSLTVARVSENGFSISMIPHTADVTALGRKRTGDIVNLECDIIGKYVERLLSSGRASPVTKPHTSDRASKAQSTLTADFLASNGFF